MATPRRAAAAAGVVLAHLALVTAWHGLTDTTSMHRQPPDPGTPLWVRLVSLPPLPAAPQAAPARPAQAGADRIERPERAAPARAAPNPASPAEPAPRSAAPQPAAERSTAPVTELFAVPAEPPASVPLRLDLPRGGPGSRIALPPRHPALDDSRAQTAPPTIEQRIGRATAGQWTEEPLGDGRVRYRRGEDCIVAVPSRDGTLDPFNQAAAPKPRGAGQC